ncbi:hypothetical protein [Pseudomonas sp.]|uniref:hypothetical protein n=1 Tax=Pseudomonas sp. TaxID=306 RepID=UPI003FD738BB
MNGAKKTIIIDGVATEVEMYMRGDQWAWVRDPKGDTHILPIRFWAGSLPRWRSLAADYELPATVGKDQSLIQRIEYALHSRYDADNRLLLEEALAVLKEKA